MSFIPHACAINPVVPIRKKLKQKYTKDKSELPMAIAPICSILILPIIEVSTIPNIGVEILDIIIGIAIAMINL